MKSPLLCALAIGILATSAGAVDDGNPYRKAKVGDYYQFKTSTKIQGIGTEGTMTQTVTAKTDKEATIAITGKLTAMGMEVMIPARTETIDLSKPYDPTRATENVPPGAEVKVEKGKEGEEKLKLGSKTYASTWTAYKMKMKNMGMEIEADMKVWRTQDVNVPMVKLEMTSEVAGNKIEVTMELEEFGNKPIEKPAEKK